MATKVIIKSREFSALKKVASIINADVTKAAKLNEQIAKLQAELDATQASIDANSTYWVNKTGYQVNDLVIRSVVERTTAKGEIVPTVKYEPNMELLTEGDNGSYSLIFKGSDVEDTPKEAVEVEETPEEVLAEIAQEEAETDAKIDEVESEVSKDPFEL